METSTQSFFKDIENQFGVHTKKMMKNFISINKKLASLLNRKAFLTKCRRHKISPKSLMMNLKAFRHCIPEGVSNRLKKVFSQTLLNEVINEIFRNITRTSNTAKKIEENLKDKVPAEVFKQFTDQVKTTNDLNSVKQQTKLSQRFEKLMAPELNKTNKAMNNENWVKNLTGTTIPQQSLNVLSLGQKFNLPTSNEKIPVRDIISNLEPTIQRLETPTDRTEMRNKLCNILTNHKKMRTKKSTFECILKHQVKETKTFLKEHPEILVVNADKGNVTVLINKTDYMEKMKSLLNDEKTYRVLPTDPTNKIQAKCNRVITQWKNSEYITIPEARKLRRYNAVIAKLYGTIKIHKEGEPARPVVASIDSPTYNLSKMYADILKNVTGKTRRAVKNSTEFKQKIDNVRIPEGYELVSLDVVSLFTNIPTKLVLQAIDRYWFQIKKFTTLPKNEFVRGLKLVIENCTFSFDNVIYEQIFGSPMGSPVSPVLADLVMEMLEENTIRKLKFRLPFYSRFVDDCMTSCPKGKSEELLEQFNQYDVNLQFTKEVENENKIPFLDLLLIRQDNGEVKTNWYHKNTWSGRYLNYHSSMPYTYKRNTITILTQKVMKLADPMYHQSNFQLILETLMKNGYPEEMVKNIMLKTRNNETTANTSNSEKTTRFVSVPYVKGVFEKIKPIFKKHDITIVGKGHNNLKSNLFSSVKDKVPVQKQSNVVYSIKCSCSKVYIGQSSRWLEKRMADHKYNARIKNNTHSALCDHLINSGHEIDWNNVEVVHRERKQKCRDVMEMILIKTTPDTINRQNECKYLSNAYDNII